MFGNIDYNKCTIVSYGASDATTQAQTGLHSVDLILVPGQNCASSETLGSNVLCFQNTSGDDLICSGDAGAPVYCKAISNGEDILIGVAGTVSTCGGDGGSVPVIPVAN